MAIHLTERQLKEILKKARTDNRGKNIYSICPKCGHDEFGISLKDQHRFGCFRRKKCGFKGNIYTLLKFLEIPFDKYGGAPDVNMFQEGWENFWGEDDTESHDYIMPKPIPPPPLWKRLYQDDYLDKRGFTKDQYEIFKVGRSKINKNYITILVEMDGDVRGYVSRSSKSKEWHDKHKKTLRYRNSNTDFETMLFGIDEVNENTHTVILVEGIFDKTKTDSNLKLYSSDDIKCCATFGGHVTDDQIKLLQMKGVQNIILLFESDILKDVIKAANELGSKFLSVKVGYLPIDKDPNQLNSHELIRILERLEDFVEFQFNHYEEIVYE